MTTLTPSLNSSRTCEPRWATKRTPSRPTLGGKIARIAQLLGKPFMPWQRLVADVGFELVEDPDTGLLLPAFREVIDTVPRQQGKTILDLAVECERAMRPDQLIIYTAQTGQDARKKLLEDQVPIIEKSPLKAAVRLTARGDIANKAAGAETIHFKTGSRIALQASTDSAGHGETVDLGVIDEAFADEDGYREGSLVPAMLTNADAQLVVASTMGTEKSAYLNRKVDAGRDAVARGETSGTAYFEWSAPDDADIDDPATWWACMPALGFTITEDVVRHAREMWREEEGLFRRTMLNQRTISEERVIPVGVWNAVCGDIAPEDKLVIGIDVHPDRSSASIAVADYTGRCELVDRRDGVGWLVDRTVELAKRYDAEVVLDKRGPAASFVTDLASKDVYATEYATEDMARACAAIFDAIADRNIQVRRHPSLDTAAAALRKRQMGDVWVWGRKDANADVCPFVALTLAFDRAVTLGRDGDVWVSW